VTQRDGKNVVFAVVDGKASAKSVTPQQTYGDLRLVEGIGAGVRVVKEPPAAMSDGAGVIITPEKK
jgi:hypothetical protein